MRRIAAAQSNKVIITADDDKAEHVTISVPASQFLFSQASIVASVMLEPNSHLIRPQFSKYVNNNGDTWSNDSLKANHGSWIGAYNFVNHQAKDDYAVGVIADTALRRNYVDSEKNLYNYYNDILIATHRDFTALCKQVACGGIEYLSMGCDAEAITCSKCGHKAMNDVMCPHSAGKGKFFVDKSGTRRICAEILGNTDPGTVNFTEASWLSERPAFHGAVKRNILPIEKNAAVSISMPYKAMERDAFVKFFKQ